MLNIFFIAVSLLSPPKPTEKELDTIYYSLEPNSISKQFAFYHLYPETKQGRKALLNAWRLLCCAHPGGRPIEGDLQLPELDFAPLIRLVNQQPHAPKTSLNSKQISLIQELASPLPNRKLKGNQVFSRAELRKLPSEEIDLARALLLEQYENPQENRKEITTYEATLDLMALQVLARLPEKATDREKIREISNLIFHEKGYRFPPHSLHIKDIDLYTFLPSVLDTHEGVCLGVSILYLCLAQRLDLPLEIITPPGHIYVCYEKGEEKINIETTARGIHVDDEAYLSINTRSLNVRTMREVVGMAAFNQASVFWQRGEHDEAIKRYRQAAVYMVDDPLVKMFLGVNLLIKGEKKEGAAYLKAIAGKPFPWAVSKETMPEDYLNGHVDVEGLKAIYSRVDESRTSILAKQKDLHKILKRFPRFRDGWFHLAITYLQLGRGKEGLECLQAYHALDSQNPTVEYYLAALSLERSDLRQAAKHFEICRTITSAKDHYPKALKSLDRSLRNVYPR
ncbi:MAG: transglutaminase family protein [Candidatus Algichlamydia australiensis]|nr:transglutaminase family protein [Chlamydiales bacterium]